MLGGHDAGRADEDHAEPNQQWQPVFDKLSHSLVGRLCQTRAKHDGVSQKRPTKSVNLKSAIHNPQSELASPFAFEPIFMERMWGGRRLESEFHKKLPPHKRIGESWEIVDRPKAQSVVATEPLRGRTLHELWTQHRQEIFGEVPDTPRFPLLIKILDAQKKLSLQVHPPENIASSLGAEPKTEFFLGFREAITRKRLEEMLRDGSVIDCVQKVAVHAGDALFLPAGRLHAV